MTAEDNKSNIRTALPWILLAVALLVIGGLIGFVVGSGGDDSDPRSAPTSTAATSTTVPITSSSTTAAPPTTRPPQRDFPDIFEQARSAVAEVEVTACSSSSTGTAFLIGDDLAVTAWHVVDGAAGVTLEFGGERVNASVVGRDPDRDIALLVLDTPIADVPLLRLAQQPPRVGEEVAAMGHPRGLPLALTVGRVTSMNGSFDFGTDTDGSPLIIDDLIQTDAVVAPGNSGGPLVNGQGEVVGVVVLLDLGAPGLMYATDTQASLDRLAEWSLEREALEAAFCVGPVDITGDLGDVVASDSDHPAVDDLMRTYAVYQLSINSGRPQEAFQMLGPTLSARTTAAEWAAGQQTSSLWAFRIRDVREVDDQTLDVRVTFESTQAPEFGRVPGETCTRWDLTHRMVRGSARGREFWLIDGATANPGSPVSCADFVPANGATNAVDLDGRSSLATQGSLSAGSLDRWEISLTTGQQMQIDADAEAFDTVLRVVGPGDADVGFNDDRGDGSLNSSLQFIAGVDGVYVVEVSDFGHDHGGEYELTFTLGP